MTGGHRGVDGRADGGGHRWQLGGGQGHGRGPGLARRPDGDHRPQRGTGSGGRSPTSAGPPVPIRSTSWLLDLADLSSVRDASAEMLERYDGIHVLVNNAGLVLSARTETVDGLEATLATNHLGPFLLTGLLPTG